MKYNISKQEDLIDIASNFAELRELFIKRMTIDSAHNDRRRKDFNQAIFRYEDKADVDAWNKDCAKYGLAVKEYGRTYPVWCEMDMDMVLQCFDNAVKDWQNKSSYKKGL